MSETEENEEKELIAADAEMNGEAKKEKKEKKKKKKKNENISYSQELARKLIHLCSLSIPIFYFFVDKDTALLVLIPMAVFAVALDIVTKKVKPLREIYKKYFGQMLRKHERKKKKILLNGASWVLISAVLTVFAFTKITAITGFTILIVSDISAALIGRKFGKTPLFNKSWEGTSAFIISAFIVVSVVGCIVSAPLAFFIAGAFAAVVSGFVEAASKVLKVDDNLSIPISFGIVLWFGAYISSMFGVQILNLL